MKVGNCSNGNAINARMICYEIQRGFFNFFQYKVDIEIFCFPTMTRREKPMITEVRLRR